MLNKIGVGVADAFFSSIRKQTNNKFTLFVTLTQALKYMIMDKILV